MLDFYLISDNQPKPYYPEKVGLEYIGGLDSDTFENLKSKGIIDKRFDYYSDFRWGTLLIKQIKQRIIQYQFQADQEIKKLSAFLDLAEQKSCGLIAYGD